MIDQFAVLLFSAHSQESLREYFDWDHLRYTSKSISHLVGSSSASFERLKAELEEC